MDKYGRLPNKTYNNNIKKCDKCGILLSKNIIKTSSCVKDYSDYVDYMESVLSYDFYISDDNITIDIMKNTEKFIDEDEKYEKFVRSSLIRVNEMYKKDKDTFYYNYDIEYFIPDDFYDNNFIDSYFCKDKLCKEFIKLRFDGAGMIKFLSKVSEIRYTENKVGNFDHIIVIVGIFSDGTDLVIENKNVLNMGEYPYVLDGAVGEYDEENPPKEVEHEIIY